MVRKKILYLEGNTDGTVGGSYYCLYDLVKNINIKKYNPIVVFRTNNTLIPKFHESGIETHIIKKPKAINFKSIFKKSPKSLRVFVTILTPLQKFYNVTYRFILPALKIAFYLRKYRFDLVHLNNSIVRNDDFMFATKIARVKCLTHERGINTYYPKTARFFGKHLEAIIAISDAVKDNLRIHGINYPNIITIYDCIDTNRMQLTKRSEEIRKIFRIDASSPVIGVVGNIKEWKGQEAVIKAVELIKKKEPKIVCLLVGAISSENFYQKLLNLCYKLRLEKNIIFTGFQENVADFMNVVDVVIHSSIEPEPFGIVNLEAMALKKPVVSTNIGAPLEVIVDGKTGLLVTPGDPVALARAVMGLLSDRNMRNRMGKAGYKRLCEEFTLSRNVQRTEALYDKIFSQAGK